MLYLTYARLVQLLIALLVANSSFAQVFFDVEVFTEDSFQRQPYLISADLDGDGDLDIASANMNALLWYENLDGMGNFSVNKLISTDVDWSKWIYAGDFDGDDDLDLFIATRGDQEVSWFENLDGLGNFGPKQVLVVGGDDGVGASLVDFNGDNFPDLLYAFRGRIGWMENLDGQGTLGEDNQLNLTAWDFTKVRYADLDHDDDFDVVATSGNMNQLVWYENLDGLGTFSEEQLISDEYAYASDVFIGDLDGDGLVDIACGDGIGLYWHRAVDGEGNFESRIQLDQAADIYLVHADDVDGDGDLDLFGGSRFDDWTAWYENDGLGNFGPRRIIDSDADYVYSIHSGDLDGDGSIDFLGGSSVETAWFKNTDGVGNFDLKIGLYLFIPGIGEVNLADIDNDGLEDLVVGGWSSIIWFKNVNGLGFVNATELSGGGAIAPADLDNDGDLDILSRNGYDVYWFENLDGAGTFGPMASVITEMNSIYSVEAADIDGDNDLDIFLVSQGGNMIAWFENLDGAGTFSSPVIIDTGGGVRGSDIADLDSDGDLDIVVAEYYGDRISWLENLDGQGTFSDKQEIESFWESVSLVRVWDVDGDGMQDVIFGAADTGKIRWKRNLGQGQFDNPQFISNSSYGVRSVQKADFDNDGDYDITMACYNSGDIEWAEYDAVTDQFLEVQKVHEVAARAYSVDTGDIDQDGDQDIIFSSTFSNRIGLCYNVPFLGLDENYITLPTIIPNPAFDSVKIEWPEPITAIKVYDGLGQLVLEQEESGGMDSLNVRGLPTGVYILLMRTSSDQVFTQRLIKE